MSQYIHKSHNVSVLMYHIVFPAKYRRAVLTEEVDNVLKDNLGENRLKWMILNKMRKKHEIPQNKFLEIFLL